MLIKIVLLLLLAMSFSASATTFESKNSPVDANSTSVQIGNATLDILFSDNIPAPKKPEFLSWVTRSAKTVSDYYDGFPVKQAGITIIGVDEPGVRTGRAMQGRQIPQLLIWVGIGTNSKTLTSDWVMIHEMIHLATATLERKHRWLEEGLSVYIESISRAQAGELEPSRIWNEFAKRMPNGQLRAGDKGLDSTPRWGRTYWGGAVFFLIADMKIRQMSNNSLALFDALKSNINEGLTMNTNASIQELIDTMDKSLPSPQIKQLYNDYALQAKPFPLAQIWRELGVDPDGSAPPDENAPLACIRRAMTKKSMQPC